MHKDHIYIELYRSLNINTKQVCRNMKHTVRLPIRETDMKNSKLLGTNNNYVPEELNINYRISCYLIQTRLSS